MKEEEEKEAAVVVFIELVAVLHALLVGWLLST
jgi:hypothetical protein